MSNFQYKLIIMKFIEFAITSDINTFSPTILLLDCTEICSIQKTEKQDLCKIVTKQGMEYFALGLYKTLTNRLFYTLSKKHNLYEDDVIRPSIRVLHRNASLEPDSAFFDPIQLKGFIYGINENFPSENLPEYTKEVFSKIKWN